MVYTGQVIRLFVSSTFSDFHPERDALQQRVFPQLRKLCHQRGARFQAIDLRWGVSREAGRDQRTLTICLDEVRRCLAVSPDVNFLVLLGERYGSQILPEHIPTDEFRLLKTHMDPGEQERVERWYQIDLNADPPVAVLQPRLEEFSDDEKWKKEQQALLSLFDRACQQARLADSARMKYIASATELEINEGIFLPDRHDALCFFRTIRKAPPDASANEKFSSFFEEPGMPRYQRLQDLKQRLRDQCPHSFFDYEAQWAGDGCTREHLEQFCQNVYNQLKIRIEQSLAQAMSVYPVVDPHQTFLENLTSHFTGREAAMEAINTYLQNNDALPLIVTGRPGSGKTTLLAYSIQEARRNHPEAVVCQEFVGVDPEASSTRSLLERLSRAIANAYGGDETTVPTDETALLQQFPDRLAAATADRPLFVFIDALDQLRDQGQRGLWIPLTLPRHVRFLLSISDGPALGALRGRHPQASVFTLQPLTRDEGERLLTAWLSEGEGGEQGKVAPEHAPRARSQAKRTLQPEQMRTILDGFEASKGLPLYLRLAYVEARRWPSYAEVSSFPSSISELLQRFFKQLADPRNHGEVLVAHTLGYLGAARYGLSEDEIVDVLSDDQDVMQAIYQPSEDWPKPDHLPMALWSRLYFDLEPYLAERIASGARLITFYHMQLAVEVNKTYLRRESVPARFKAHTYHQALARYFAKKPVDQDAPPTLRKLAEQPYQQTEGEMWDDLYMTLTDFQFLEAKAKTGKTVRQGPNQGTLTVFTGIYDLQEDFDRALKQMPQN